MCGDEGRTWTVVEDKQLELESSIGVVDNGFVVHTASENYSLLQIFQNVEDSLNFKLYNAAISDRVFPA